MSVKRLAIFNKLQRTISTGYPNYASQTRSTMHRVHELGKVSGGTDTLRLERVNSIKNKKNSRIFLITDNGSQIARCRRCIPPSRLPGAEVPNTHPRILDYHKRRVGTTA